MESSASARLPQVQSHQIEPAKVRIGTAGWSYKDWDGIFYPSGMSSSMSRRKQHPLEYLTRFFDTTEINTSFYGPLKPEWAKLWCRKVAAVNKNFLFTAKLYRAFTHSVAAIDILFALHAGHVPDEPSVRRWCALHPHEVTVRKQLATSNCPKQEEW